jgi:hypothetical protein
VNPLKVDYLDRRALAELVRDPVAAWLEFDERAIDRVDAWSARNPYFATLICISVWQHALRSRDRCVTGRDIDGAVAELAANSSRNSYQHFWSDSPLESDRERDLRETTASYVVLALAKLQQGSFDFVRRTSVIRDCEGLSPAEAEAYLDELIVREVVEADGHDASQVRFRVPLFAAWLHESGAADIRQAQSLKGRIDAASPSNELSAAEVAGVANGLVYRGRSTTTDDVRAWASQFGALDDQRLMVRLLERLKNRGLFALDEFLNTLKNLEGLVRQDAVRANVALVLDSKGVVQNRLVTHTDEPGKSGSEVLKQYRSANRIHESYCGSPQKVVAYVAGHPGPEYIVVSVNDFVGSGQSAIEGLEKRLLLPLRQSQSVDMSKLHIVYATVAGFEDGLQSIENAFAGVLSVFAARTFSSEDKAFSEDNDIFETAAERIRARDVAQRFGAQLEKNQPLGFEDSQALVVFPDNVPNNSLPIFYKEGQLQNGHPWRPLFPRS